MNIFLRIIFISFCLLAALAHADTTSPENKFALTTNAFMNKMTIPTLYTCDGKDVSPELNWSGIPANTASFVVIMKDIDAPGGIFYHWVLYNIPNNISQLAQAASVPTGASAGPNHFGKSQYNGPCPPPKGSAHTYIITLYALDNKLVLPKDADASSVIAAMNNHIIGQVELTGVYSRQVQ